MRSMGHPDYVYRPMSAAERKKRSAAHLRRLGIPLGFRRVFGALVSEEHAEEFRRVMAQRRYKKGRK